MYFSLWIKKIVILFYFLFSLSHEMTCNSLLIILFLEVPSLQTDSYSQNLDYMSSLFDYIFLPNPLSFSHFPLTHKHHLVKILTLECLHALIFRLFSIVDIILHIFLFLFVLIFVLFQMNKQFSYTYKSNHLCFYLLLIQVLQIGLLVLFYHDTLLLPHNVYIYCKEYCF